VFPLSAVNQILCYSVSVVEDTIIAVGTPVGEGALAVLRLSGSDALKMISRVFRSRKSELTPRHAHYGEIYDSAGKLDEVLVTFFPGPKSYTGEDLIEISCHGGVLITRRILELFLKEGARSATPGEFTQRAFLNGKMDLTQAEAVMDLIRAQTELALRAANEQLAGNLGSDLMSMREQILTALAHIEAYIDFPDEQIDPDTGKALLARFRQLGTQIDRLLATADQGRILRHGLRTVIFGEPNVGKSSLLNLLLGYERAIVSHIPGTTRDTIEEVINVRGIPVRLIDTAGTRESTDTIESEGIRRTLQQVDQADLVIEVVDGSKPDSRFDRSRQTMLILNKSDLGLHPDWKIADEERSQGKVTQGTKVTDGEVETKGILFSCTERVGVEELNQAIWDRVMGGAVQLNDVRVAINARHQACLQRAKAALAQSVESLERGQSPEFISIELRDALDAVGEVVGKTDSEDLLGKIFSEFCIGK
jgi:tRNA modification GTPase